MASIVEQLRNSRQGLLEEREPLTLSVPGYREKAGVDLLVRYRTPEWEAIQEINAAAAESTDKRASLNAQADVLIRACEGIYASKDGKTLISLSDNGHPVRYEPALGEALGFTAETAREALFEAFPPDYREWGVETHFNRVAAWAEGGIKEVDEAVVGEAEATPGSPSPDEPAS